MPPFGTPAKATTARSISAGSRALTRVVSTLERRRQRLHDAKLAYSRRRRRITKYCDARYRRRNLLEQFEPLSADAEFECHEPRSIPPGPGQVLDETGPDRIGDDHEHNRHRPRYLQQRAYRRGARA